MKKNADMIVAGVMSGTSADGINVALVHLLSSPVSSSRPSSSRNRAHPPRFELLAHAEYAYPRPVRTAILAAMNATRASVADLSRLNFLLGELYAEAVFKAQRRFHLEADLVGCHGQTLYHQGHAKKFLGHSLSTTWQTGEAAVIAGRLGVPVVSDFRPADMAAGGRGAPLVPYLDYALFRDRREARVIQNIGGIANFTFIPAAASPAEVLACDTGPGNMIIDAVTEKLFGQLYDRGGKIAATGTADEAVVKKILQRKFFRRPPPRTAGREEFGREFVREFLQSCRGLRKEDVIATATALTAHSIADSVRRFALTGTTIPPQSSRAIMIASGGGTKNRTLMTMLANELTPLGVELRVSDDFGLPSQAKEATAFALLAHETWHQRPSNIPSATGAKRPAILGKISYA